MKTETRNLLGFDVPVVGIAETLQEAIAAAGSEQEVCDTYVGNVLAHSHYTILRKKIVETLESVTGVKRLTRKEKDKDVYDETEGQYVARLADELGEEGLAAHNKAVADACGLISVDYSPSSRGGSGPATPAKKWLAYYDELKKQDKVTAFCEKFDISTVDSEGQPLDEETIRVSVANKARELVLAQQRAAEKALMGV